jgi:tRNA pseudouridine38-40 synthase
LDPNTPLPEPGAPERTALADDGAPEGAADAERADAERAHAEPSERFQHPDRVGVLLTLAYDGASYSGFVAQNNTARTIASDLSRAISVMDPRASALRVASRTDAGVHARGQIACFASMLRIQSRGWLLGLSGHLPPQIAVQRVARVAPNFNPSKAAVAKTYRYLILRGTVRDPFLDGRAWRVHDRLDVEAMQREAESLLGTHDFAAFRGRNDRRTTTVRTISVAALREVPGEPRCIAFEIRGDRFLYHMVRIIVGTLVDVGRGNCAPGAIARAQASGARTDLGMTAPPDGLCLERIELADSGHDEWPNHW